MRIKKECVNLDYDRIKHFFEERTKVDNKNSDNPYGATMYQDGNENLAKNRNQSEKEQILPLLNLDSESVVLDIACGEGRWADTIKECDIKQYWGTDYCDGLLEIARNRIKKDNFQFLLADVLETKEILLKNIGGGHKLSVNRIILSGILLYLNDKDIDQLFVELNTICDVNTRIYIRGPVGIEERLTLKDFYSEELKKEYNAIYRTRDEYYELIKKTFLKNGFRIEEERYLFENVALNNREETRQYFFILTNEN